MKNYVQPGNVISLTSPYDVTAGDGLLVGSIFGVAAGDAANGAAVEAQVVGVFDIAKTSAQAWSPGAKVYWDDMAKEATTTSAGNTLIGVAIAAAANPSAIGRVRLNGSF